MPPSRKLFSMNVSIWSERARWALDHHALYYKLVEHMPVLGERRLRRLVGPGKARATVPVLVTDGEVVSESWDIAVYADREGRGTKLIPPEHEAAIRDWVALADDAACAGRAMVMAAMLASRPAIDEQLPNYVPAWLRLPLRPFSRAATMAFVRKYALRLNEGDAQRGVMRSALERLRRGLEARSPYLQGSFSYADIAMATLIQAISPVDDRYLKIGPATRASWTEPALASAFADLVAWRDRLYASDRRAAKP
jgi:glutathione S-transferase